MKALAAKVRWNEDKANDPDLIILLDTWPKKEELRYQRINAGRCIMWYAERDGYVSFFCEDPRNQTGFDGEIFHIIKENDEPHDLVGPWSSNATAMEKVGFPPSVHVSFTEEPEAYERGWTLYAGMVSLEFAQKVVEEFLPGVELRRNHLGFWHPWREGSFWKEDEIEWNDKLLRDVGLDQAAAIMF